MLATCPILDVRVHRVSFGEALDEIDRFVRSGAPHQVVTVNSDFIRLAGTNPEFRAVINAADLAVADGMPLIWASRLLGTPLPERVTGVDLMDHSAALAARSGYRVFLLGAGPGVAQAAAEELTLRHRGLSVAGVLTPPMGPFSEEEDARLVAAVRSARPHLLFVALGAPRQEIWIHRHLTALDVPVCIGVGGAFDLIARRIARAPVFMQRTGLEWAHRLVQEPGRLWHRYLLGDVPVVLRMLGDGLLHGATQR